MSEDLMSRAVREFGICVDDLAGPDDARSGAGVHPVRTRGGLAVYLKLTPVGLGSGMLSRARRELDFYQRLADQVPVSTPPLLGTLDTDDGVALLLTVVHAPDGLVFCDWQSVGPGRAISDLAHLSVRATPAGVTIPPELTAAYLAGSGADPVDLERALVVSELAVFIFVWPPYAAYNDQIGISRVHDRTRLLARKWLAS